MNTTPFYILIKNGSAKIRLDEPSPLVVEEQNKFKLRVLKVIPDKKGELPPIVLFMRPSNAMQSPSLVKFYRLQRAIDQAIGVCTQNNRASLKKASQAALILSRLIADNV